MKNCIRLTLVHSNCLLIRIEWFQYYSILFKLNWMPHIFLNYFDVVFINNFTYPAQYTELESFTKTSVNYSLFHFPNVNDNFVATEQVCISLYVICYNSDIYFCSVFSSVSLLIYLFFIYFDSLCMYQFMYIYRHWRHSPFPSKMTVKWTV